MDDPRKAKTLGEASANLDGKTFNGLRTLSWLSGLPLDEVKKLAAKVMAERGKKTPHP